MAPYQEEDTTPLVGNSSDLEDAELSLSGPDSAASASVRGFRVPRVVAVLLGTGCVLAVAFGAFKTFAPASQLEEGKPEDAVKLIGSPCDVAPVAPPPAPASPCNVAPAPVAPPAPAPVGPPPAPAPVAPLPATNRRSTTTTTSTTTPPQSMKGTLHTTLPKDCGTEWETQSSAEPEVKEAAEKAFKLLDAKRQHCDIPVSEFPFDSEAFTQGDGHRHYMHAHVKYASDCKSKTFKLHFFLGSDNLDQTTFVVQVNQAQSWTLLDGTSPPACDIQTGSSAAPQAIALTAKPIRRAATFAAVELANQMTTAGCGCTGNTTVASINGAVASVNNGLVMTMILDMKAAGCGKENKDLEATMSISVIERCGGSGECVRQLALDDKACNMFLDDSNASRKLLQTSYGAEPEDPTEVMVSLNSYMRNPRRLGGNKRAPLMNRYIKTGSIARSHDPRTKSCFTDITVYNQGSCGSCYAQAIAQMMGIRKCMVDRGQSRRLQDDPEETENELPMVAGAPFEENQGDAAEEQEQELEDETEGRELAKTSCADNTQWQNNYYGLSCKWFAANDNGCTHYKDYGQRTNCKKTCNKCPQVYRQNSNSNPWHTAV